MDEQDTQEFSLEDILKEFGSPDGEAQPPEEGETEVPAEESPAEEAPVEEPSEGDAPEEVTTEEETTEEAPKEEAPPEESSEAPQPASPDDTVRFEKDPGKAGGVTGDTIRLDDVTQALGDTRRVDIPEEALPESQEPEAPETEETPGEEAEPFAPGWEPEYDQPIGEYVPPEPIAFHPHPRLRELKQKLVEGPEKRYYDLSEQGLGKLQFGIFFSLLVTLLSGCSLLLYGLGVIGPGRIKLMVYGQVLCMLLCALTGAYRLLDGIGDLFRRRFTLNTLLVFLFGFCLADGILGLRNLQIPFCGAFCLEMTMAQWAAWQRRNTEMGQMDTMRKATMLDSVVKCDNVYDGRRGFLRGEGLVEDFMDHYAAPSGPEKAMSVYAICALVASVAVGAAGWFLRDPAFGVHAAAAALLAAVPATAFVTLTRPMSVLEKRLHRVGTVLCGWKGVLGLCGDACVPLSDGDLFPKGTVKMNGMKFYGSREPDQVVAYAAALIMAEGGGLSPVFEALLDSRSGRYYDVTALRSYDNGGLGGEINGEPVLVGVLSFMRDMGVDMPEGTRVNQAVYVAIDGELGGVFAITYGKTRAGAAGLTTLCGYRNLTPVLTSRDFMLTEGFLRGKFGVNTRRMEFPERSVRYALSQLEPDGDAPTLALTTQEGIAPMAFAITGARALRTASRAGLVTHLIAGILGLGVVALLSVLGNLELLSPGNLMLYELVWLIPGLLITEWTRAV